MRPRVLYWLNYWMGLRGDRTPDISVSAPVHAGTVGAKPLIQYGVVSIMVS